VTRFCVGIRIGIYIPDAREILEIRGDLECEFIGRSLNGKEAEQRAEQFLLWQDLVLLERNFRCPFGEIDLIMRDRGAIVFVEVRMRRNNLFGGAASSVTPVKQGKLLRTARYYLAKLARTPACRFDVVLLTGNEGDDIEWIKNAFGE
jgi:putative endonuclease